MASIVQNGRLFWLNGLQTAKIGHSSDGVQQWVLNGNYTFSDKPTKKKFEIFPCDKVAAAFAGDISRLSCAAFESACSVSIPSHSNNATGWIAITSYYSAYFAANALMRVFGFACSNLSIEHTSVLKGQVQNML